MKYWIGVVSAEHVARGVEQGILQLGHGKRSGVARLKKDDGFIYYSSKAKMTDKELLQEFTALGFVADDEPYQVEVSEDFKPWRRHIKYEPVTPLPIRPILDELSFITDKTHWGAPFRYGLLEIPQKDFDFIARLMCKN